MGGAPSHHPAQLLLASHGPAAACQGPHTSHTELSLSPSLPLSLLQSMAVVARCPRPNCAVLLMSWLASGPALGLYLLVGERNDGPQYRQADTTGRGMLLYRDREGLWAVRASVGGPPLLCCPTTSSNCAPPPGEMATIS